MCHFKRIVVLAAFALTCGVPVLDAQHLRIPDAGPVTNAATNPPTVLKSVIARYTDDARISGIEGTVTIEGVIDENGAMTSPHIIKGLGFGLDETALESVREWTFSPAVRDRVPVALAAQVDVQFNLRNANALQIGAGMTRPKVLSQVPAQYTEPARLAKIRECTVIIQAVVNRDFSQVKGTQKRFFGFQR
jgi:TonB family protein